MPYFPDLESHKDNQRQPLFVVFHKGSVIAKGSALDLEELFGQHARSLKQQLLQQCDESDDEQLKRRYQVMRYGEYEQSKKDIVAYTDELLLEIENAYVRPDCELEEELAFNPNNEQLKRQIERKNSRYHRYYRKHRVARWKAAEAFPHPTELQFKAGDHTIVAANTEEGIERASQEIGNQRLREAAPAVTAERRRTDRWVTKKTKEELEFLERRSERLKAARPKSIWL